MPEFQVGQKVLYSPDLIHAVGAFAYHYQGGECKHLFDYVHHGPTPVRPQTSEEVGQEPMRPGQPADVTKCGRFTEFNRATNVIKTAGGYELKVVGPKRHWEATVVRVNADGTCDLEITHPGGHAVFHCPTRDPYVGPVCATPTGKPENYLEPEDRPGVRYDKKKAPHTFHLEND